MAHVEDLLQQVWLHPEDDQVRLVLADALMAVGDPRGELIQLQIQSPRDHAVRIMRLLQAHGLTWLGPLRGAVVPLSYERGFLASCVLHDETGVAGLDEWSTVHTIEIGNVEDVSLLADPVMRSLRHVREIDADGLWQLLEQPPLRVEHIACKTEWSTLPVLVPLLGAVPALQAIELDHPLPLVLRRGADDRLSVIECEFNAMVIDVLRRLPIDALTRLAVTDVPPDQMEILGTMASRQRRLTSLELVPHEPVYNY